MGEQAQESLSCGGGGGDGGDGFVGQRVLLNQGAEARVYEATFLGRPAVVKERFSKKYRHPVLDGKLTSRRLHGEARSLLKARKLGVATPVLFSVDPITYSLTFERIQGPSVKDLLLQDIPAAPSAGDIEKVMRSIGTAVARLHDGGLVHGDLTTSNMLLRSDACAAGAALVLIDFGLSQNSTLPEDKAVDLYVLERALTSLHSSHGPLMETVLEAYRRASRYWSSTFNKLAQVRMRGRKRVMVG